ncbi:MAG: hypothetical protein J5628_06510 [Lachnospiraceae bacterium]|nr:hypothetical protein [Lachnospiraceae bacterium]
MSRWILKGRRFWLAAAAFVAAIVLVMLPGRISARAEGEKAGDYVNVKDYEDGYYDGEITGDSARVRKEPGTKTLDGKTKKTGDLDDTVKSSAGKQAILKKGTKVTIWGEKKDSDLDTWYHIKFTLDGEELEGYVFKGSCSRKGKITFSPTPTPEPTATPEPTPTTVEQKGELINAPSPTRAPDTQEMVESEKKNPSSKWKYFLIIVGIILLGGAVFTAITWFSEKKIDEEMHRNNRRTYEVERLEGESEEDFREARKSAIKGQLKDQTDRDIADEIGVDEFKLDLDGVFDEEDATQGAVSEAVTEAVTEDAIQTAADNMASNAAEAAEAVAADAVDEWNTQDEAFLKHLSENADEQEKALIAQIVPNYATHSEGQAIAEPAAPAEPEATPEVVIRAALDALKEQDTLVHKEYGVGEVIDNSDPQIIQVRFGRDLRFLKKDRLARKQLVDM